VLWQISFVRKPNAAAVMAQLPSWFAHYNALHPHKALGDGSPLQFIAEKRSTLETRMPEL
jgi:putative transposase